VPSSGRPNSLATVVTCGKLSRMLRIWGESLEASSNEIVYGAVARNPQRAFIQVRHEFRADIGNQHQGSAEDRQDQGHRDQPVPQAPSESPAVQVPANPFEDRHHGFVHMLAEKKGAQHGSTVKAQMSEPSSANDMVSAMGWNNRPEGPVKNVDRQVSGDDHRDGVEDGTLHVARGCPG